MELHTFSAIDTNQHESNVTCCHCTLKELNKCSDDVTIYLLNHSTLNVVSV